MKQGIFLFSFQWTDENQSINDYVRRWCRRHDVEYRYKDQQLELCLGGRWETIEAVPQNGRMDVYLGWPLEYQYHDLLAACSRHILFREDEVPLHDYYYSLKEVDSLEQLREKMEYSWAVRKGFVLGNFAFINATASNKDWVAMHKGDDGWEAFECLDLPELMKDGTEWMKEFMEKVEQQKEKMVSRQPNDKFQLRPARPDEANLFYSTIDQAEDRELACIGHLRLDFGHHGREFWTTWWPHNDELNAQPFKDEFDDLVNALREDGPLQNLSAMSRYCTANGEGALGDSGSYGYIAESERYRYCLRFTPRLGDYNGYIYAYDKQQQELNRAQQSSDAPAANMAMGGI